MRLMNYAKRWISCVTTRSSLKTWIQPLRREVGAASSLRAAFKPAQSLCDRHCGMGGCACRGSSELPRAGILHLLMTLLMTARKSARCGPHPKRWDLRTIEAQKPATSARPAPRAPALMLAHSNLPLLTTAALSSPLAVAAPQALLGSHPWRTLRRVTATPNLCRSRLVYFHIPPHGAFVCVTLRDTAATLRRHCATLRDAARAAPASAPVRLKGFVQATLSTAAPRLHPPSRNAGTVAITLGQFSVEIGAN